MTEPHDFTCSVDAKNVNVTNNFHDRCCMVAGLFLKLSRDVIQSHPIFAFGTGRERVQRIKKRPEWTYFVQFRTRPKLLFYLHKDSWELSANVVAELFWKFDSESIADCCDVIERRLLVGHGKNTEITIEMPTQNLFGTVWRHDRILLIGGIWKGWHSNASER